jgi:hypothetical protein
MAATRLIPLHVGKGRTFADVIRKSLGYIKNGEKTDDGEWVTAYECDPLTAAEEFRFSKQEYYNITGRSQGKSDVIAYHLRISFKPDETDAETASWIGYDLALKVTKCNHAFVCCTHTDKAHTHCHIVFNSVNLNCDRKFRNFYNSSFHIRNIADHLCLINGLSIIENPQKPKGYRKWLGDSKPPTNREKLEQIIDSIIPDCKSYDDFITALKDAGCEVKQGKNLSIKIPGTERFIRCKSLAENYTETAILERISGKRIVETKPIIPANPEIVNSKYSPNLLIDIQSKIQQGKGGGYERWARIFNAKEGAKTLLFLKDNGVDSYEELVEKSTAATSEFTERLNKIKAIDNRLNEISTLQKQISIYSRTLDIYKKYLRSGRDESFYESCRADIMAHEAAKKYFDSLNVKKLPSFQELKQEYAVLLADKKKLYVGYKELKEKSQKLGTARMNVERILGVNFDESRRAERGFNAR